MLKPDFNELADLRKLATDADIIGPSPASTPTVGDHASLFKGRGLDFSEFREYVPGDDVRAIDWRVTARRGRPHTKIFTEEHEKCVYVVVDLNSYMQFGTRQTFKSVQAARAAALIAWIANQRGDKVGVILFGGGDVRILPAKKSRRAIWDMLKALCEGQKASSETPIEKALEQCRRRISMGSTVFVVSDFFNLGDEFESTLAALTRRADVTLLKVSDPADRNLPSASRIEFSDGAGGRIKADTDDRKAAESYGLMWLKQDEALEKIARRVRARVLRISTDEQIRGLLRGGLSQGPKRRRAK